MSLSKDLSDSFKERMDHSTNDAGISFNVLVLGTNFWPLSPPNHEYAIPRGLRSTYDHFQAYYQTKHSGRRLTWLWNYSKNEIRTNYLDNKYIFMTSSYQTAVLLQFNGAVSLSLDELCARTLIPKHLMTQVLSTLLKAKVFVAPSEEQYDLSPGMQPQAFHATFI